MSRSAQRDRSSGLQNRAGGKSALTSSFVLGFISVLVVELHVISGGRPGHGFSLSLFAACQGLESQPSRPTRLCHAARRAWGVGVVAVLPFARLSDPAL